MHNVHNQKYIFCGWTCPACGTGWDKPEGVRDQSGRCYLCTRGDLTDEELMALDGKPSD